MFLSWGTIVNVHNRTLLYGGKKSDMMPKEFVLEFIDDGFNETSNVQTLPDWAPIVLAYEAEK